MAAVALVSNLLRQRGGLRGSDGRRKIGPMASAAPRHHALSPR